MVNAEKILTTKKSNNILRTSHQYWVMMFLSVFILCALIEPAYITDSTGANASVRQIFQISKYIASFISVFLFVASRAKINSLHINIFLFEFSLLFSTIINGASLKEWFGNCAYAIALVLFIQAAWKISPRLILQALSVVLGSYVHINLICRIIFPGGMYVHSHGYSNCWFLGYDNVAAIIILISQTVAMYQISTNRNRLMLWEKSSIFCGLLFIVIQTMATAILSEIVFFMYLFFYKSGFLRKTILKNKVIVVSMLLLFILIHFFSIQQSNLISELFHFLGKSTTFTGRTRIWEIAWDDIMQHGLILGLGMHEGTVYVNHFGMRAAAHLHCYYLQVLYEGGIIAFAFLFNIIFNTVNCFDSKHNNSQTAIFLACLFSIMITWQVEAYKHLIRYSFVIIALIYNLSKSENNNDSSMTIHI